MPARSTGFGWAPPSALIAALLPLLAGCGPARNEFAPSCPGTAILGDAADIDLYRPGGGHDLTDLIVHGRLSGIRGTCQPGSGKNQLAVTVSAVIDLTRGPAMPGRDVTVPVFLAVVDGDHIIDKHVYLMHSVFPSNLDRVTMTPGDVDLTLPISASKSGAAYAILAGFQLTSDQLDQSRRSSGQ